MYALGQLYYLNPIRKLTTSEKKKQVGASPDPSDQAKRENDMQSRMEGTVNQRFTDNVPFSTKFDSLFVPRVQQINIFLIRCGDGLDTTFQKNSQFWDRKESTEL